jgi:hypothetical protein
LAREVYTPEFYARVYDTLFETARGALTAGQAVVLDATFTEPATRARAEALAADCGVAFHGVWLDAPLAVLEALVVARTGDASDATVEVLRDQVRRHGDQDVGWTPVDATAATTLTGAAADAWVRDVT